MQLRFSSLMRRPRGALLLLLTLDGWRVQQYVTAAMEERADFQLTGEGAEIADHGSHEAIVYAAVPAEDSIAQQALLVRAGGVAS